MARIMAPLPEGPPENASLNASIYLPAKYGTADRLGSILMGECYTQTPRLLKKFNIRALCIEIADADSKDNG